MSDCDLSLDSVPSSSTMCGLFASHNELGNISVHWFELESIGIPIGAQLEFHLDLGGIQIGFTENY